jgi:prepilin-type N-terminal cleavage/methylation domain-containing protein
MQAGLSIRNSDSYSGEASARRAGFTLIEIMIVVAIMGIIVATGIPAVFRAMHKNHLAKAAADLVEYCSHARARAILQGVPFELVIRTGSSNPYDLSIEQAKSRAAEFKDNSQPAGGKDLPVSSVLPPTALSKEWPDDVLIRELFVNFVPHVEKGLSEARIRFYPNGTSDEFTIVIESKEGARKISLDMVTALADLEVIR